MSPYDHARLSVRDFGGTICNYLSIHEFLDSTKLHIPDSRHRVILHNSFGMHLCERIFGPVVYLPDNKTIAVREIARRHILQDCSVVPTLKEALISYKDNEYMQQYNKPDRQDLEWLANN